MYLGFPRTNSIYVSVMKFKVRFLNLQNSNELMIKILIQDQIFQDKLGSCSQISQSFLIINILPLLYIRISVKNKTIESENIGLPDLVSS